MATRLDASGRNLDLDSAVDEVKARYVGANPASHAQYERAKQSLPGGNTRTGMFYTPFPLSIEKAAGATLTDVDGHTYTDFVGDFSAGLYGHSHPVIREALVAALDDGMAYGSSSPYEERLATLVCARFSSIEQVRFTNSGTEANTMALVTARAVSGKDLVMVFEGAYHGGTIYFGRKRAPINMPFPFLIAPYNDAEEATRLIRENADRLAAVLVEPMQGASGAIPGEAGFLRALREACTAHGVLLIFDEVMTSRVAPNGRQGQLGITSDMTTLGKYIGGGISCGAFGGPAEIMERYDPSKPGAFVHHGTFNNNVLMLRAGAAGLEKVFTPPVQAALNESGVALRDALNGSTRRPARRAVPGHRPRLDHDDAFPARAAPLHPRHPAQGRAQGGRRVAPTFASVLDRKGVLHDPARVHGALAPHRRGRLRRLDRTIPDPDEFLYETYPAAQATAWPGHLLDAANSTS